MRGRAGKHWAREGSTDSPRTNSAANWHRDQLGSYYERYLDEDAHQTGWVTDLLWDPRWPDPPPDAQAELIDEEWALQWYSDRVVIVGSSGIRMNFPADSVISCVSRGPLDDAAKRVRLRLIVDFGGNPPTEDLQDRAYIIVELVGPLEISSRLEHFKYRLERFLSRRARGVHRRAISHTPHRQIHRGSNDEELDWHDDPYGIYTQRLRDQAGQWTGWVTDRLWDPWIVFPEVDVAVRNPAGAVQWCSEQVAMVGLSGGHLLAPASSYLSGDAPSYKRNRSGASVAHLRFKISSSAAVEAQSVVTVGIVCPLDAEDGADSLLAHLSGASPAHPTREARVAVNQIGSSGFDIVATNDELVRPRSSASSPLLPTAAGSGPLIDTLSALIEIDSARDPGSRPDLLGSPTDRSPPHGAAPDSKASAAPEASQISLARTAFGTVPAGDAWTRFVPLASADEVCVVRRVDEIN